MSSQYKAFAKYYDAFEGSRVRTINLVKKLIRKNNPKAKRVLELACGTGTILKALSNRYEVYGIDLSKEMLEIAKRKVPEAKLMGQDMSKFKVNQKFDVILCIFDSINHLLYFSDWRKVFRKVFHHLKSNGVFIFDINTLSKIERIGAVGPTPPLVKECSRNFIILTRERTRKNRIRFNITIFEHKAHNNLDAKITGQICGNNTKDSY